MMDYEERYAVLRSNGIETKQGTRFLTRAEVEDYLGSCNLNADMPAWTAALAGAPFDIDGATMRFIRVPDDEVGQGAA